MRLGHAPGVQRFGQRILGQNPFFATKFANRLPAAERFLGQLRGLFVTDQRIQARAHRQTLLHRRFARLFVRFHFVHAKFDERIGAFGQQVNRFRESYAP